MNSIRVLPTVFAFPLLFLANSVAAEPIRNQAVVDLRFDEETGPARDRASTGQVEDSGELINGPQRVSSPFWGQTGGKALLFDAGKQQYVKIPDSPDTDRPSGLTISFFFLNLHPLTDGATHGIVAKRDDTKQIANFGINYVPKADSIRPYLNDGGGFRFPDYSLKAVLGSRRLNYLTATYEIADAPAPDADTDADDVRIRFYLNGRPLTPKRPVRVTIQGDDAWVIDVNVSNLVNDVTLTLGGTNESIEFTSGVLDEFLLFDRALNPEEVGQLFREVSGDDADELAKQELKPPPNTSEPVITRLSQYGLQRGTKTRLKINGRNLAGEPFVFLPIEGFKQEVASGSKANQLIIDVEIPADAPMRIVPLRLRNRGGVSQAVAVSVDDLPVRPAEGTSPQSPAELPAAFSGLLSGPAQARVYFEGQSGQRIVADVEARRLGAKFDPVLEIKTAAGTPLAITWRKPFLRGDTRAEVTLPADGVYFAELHDLAYKAPGQNPFRIKLGDLRLIDFLLPSIAGEIGSDEFHPIGAGLPNDATPLITGSSSSLPGHIPTAPPKWNLAGPLPFVERTTAVSLTESEIRQSSTPLNAQFDSASAPPIVISGQIGEEGEADVYSIHVKPGQRLRFSVDARANGSPLDAELELLRDGNVVQRQEGRGQPANSPIARDPLMDWTVPENVENISVAVRDLHGRGGSHFVYELRIAPANRPEFAITILNPKLALSSGGTAVARLQVDRRGYNGPIALRVEGDESIRIMPDQLPAGKGRQSTFVTLTRTGSSPAPIQAVHLVGESVELQPAIRHVAKVNLEPNSVATTGDQQSLVLYSVDQSPIQLTQSETPIALFKGTTAEFQIHLARGEQLANQPARLKLLSTEAPRQIDPKDPKKGTKPLIRSLPGEFVEATSIQGTMRVAVPLDVAEKELFFVVQAEVVPHAFSDRVIATGYSEPFRLEVKQAVEVKLSQEKFAGKADSEVTISGTVLRSEGFNQPLALELTGLSKEYQSAAVTVPAGESEFSISIQIPQNAKPGDLKVKPVIRVEAGGNILTDITVPLTIQAE